MGMFIAYVCKISVCVHVCTLVCVMPPPSLAAVQQLEFRALKKRQELLALQTSVAPTPQV